MMTIPSKSMRTLRTTNGSNVIGVIIGYRVAIYVIIGYNVAYFIGSVDSATTGILETVSSETKLRRWRKVVDSGLAGHMSRRPLRELPACCFVCSLC